MQYHKMDMQNAIDKCFLRREVVEKLIEAKGFLPTDITFKVLDAYRL